MINFILKIKSSCTISTLYYLFICLTCIEAEVCQLFIPSQVKNAMAFLANPDRRKAAGIYPKNKYLFVIPGKFHFVVVEIGKSCPG